MTYTVTPKNALNAGNAHSAFAFHVYGMPYCLCTNQAMADAIDGSITLKAQIFGTNERDDYETPMYHCSRGRAIPNAIRTPTTQTISLNDTSSMIEGGDWNLEIFDKDYGIDWTASPWLFPNDYCGLPGIQFIADQGDNICTVKPLREMLSKAETGITVSDPEGDFYAQIETASQSLYLWVGNECVYVSSADFPTGEEYKIFTNEYTEDARGRGLFRSPDCAHIGDKYMQSDVISNVPLGSIAGRGCALWMLTWDDVGEAATVLRKMRHGRVKTTSIAKNGVYRISISNWTDWLKNNGKVDRLDLVPAKYIFTRGDESYDGFCSHALFTKKTNSWRAPHCGVAIYNWSDVADRFVCDMYDLWLCENNSSVVFDDWQSVMDALATELKLCWSGDGDQKTGTVNLSEVGDHAYGVVHWGELQEPIVNPTGRGYLDVVIHDDVSGTFRKYLYRFYGVIPWIMGMGCYKSKDRDSIAAMINGLYVDSRSANLRSLTFGDHPSKPIPYIYPYSVAIDGEESLVDDDPSDPPAPVEQCDWDCLFYWDSSYNMDSRMVSVPPTLPNWSSGDLSPREFNHRYSFPIPETTVDDNDNYNIYVYGDPSRLLNDELISVDNMGRVRNDIKTTRFALTGMVSGQPTYDADSGIGTITMQSGEYSASYGGIYTESEYGVEMLGANVPALINKKNHSKSVTKRNSNKNEYILNEYSSLFYVPKFHDEYYGGSPIVIRTNGGSMYAAGSLGTAIKSIFTTPSYINAASRLDNIPDIAGSTDHPSSIDFTSMSNEFVASITALMFDLDFADDFNILDVISNECMFYGVIPTWEFDTQYLQYRMKFKKIGRVNATDAEQHGIIVDRSMLSIDTVPSLVTNSSYRANALDVSWNYEFGEYATERRFESSQFKNRMGRDSAISISSRLTQSYRHRDHEKEQDTEKIKHFASILSELGRDNPTIEVDLTGKKFMSIHAGQDCVFTDTRMKDPYTGANGISARGARFKSVTYNLSDWSISAELSLGSGYQYGWAPAAYSFTSYCDTVAKKYYFVVATSARKTFSDGVRDDLSYFADWVYNYTENEYTVMSDTNFKCILIKRGKTTGAPIQVTVDASTLVLADSYDSSVVELIGLNIEDFAHTHVGDIAYIDDELIMLFDNYDVVEEPQKKYIVYSDGVGKIDDGSTTNGMKWI